MDLEFCSRMNNGLQTHMISKKPKSEENCKD